ncbi:MAG: hypothetical protein JW904_01595 [Spirochaetales bacterium]|nr:hypothetical protein [Spirochaetales bacterium]
MLFRKNSHCHRHRFINERITLKTILFCLLAAGTGILFTACPSSPRAGTDRPFTAAVVQMKVSEEIFASPTMFRAMIRSIIQEACKDSKPDIIIFPEYTSVFAALFPYMPSILQSSSAIEALDKIKKNHPDITTVQSVFIKQSENTKALVQSVFGDLALEFNTMIVAGTYFIAEKGKLYNRLVVFDEWGKQTYTQDKVFLTPIESNILQITPGDIANATGLMHKNRQLVFTICRDSLEPVWSSHYPEADIWIDIKANGGTFTKEQEESFSRFMPARLAETHITYGITACLTGTFLDYFWEGRSSVVSKKSDLKILLQAKKPTTQEVLVITLP